MIRYPYVGLCMLASLLAGCDGGPSAPRGERVFEVGPVVATDKASYSWETDSALVWILANPNGVEVFYYVGNHIHLERWDGSQWETIGLYGSPGMEFPPGRLASGDTVKASVPLSNTIFPKSGWYRVHGKVYRDTLLTTLWPIGNRVSAAVWVGP